MKTKTDCKPDPVLQQRCLYLRAQHPEAGEAVVALDLDSHEIAALCEAVLHMRYVESMKQRRGPKSGIEPIESLVEKLKESTIWVQDMMDDEAAEEGT